MEPNNDDVHAREELIAGGVYIIGAGGVASYFLPAFLKTISHQLKDLPRIYLVDGDMLEERNLERQLFDSKGVGDNKAEALRLQYKGEYKKISAVQKFFSLGSRIKEKSLLFVFVDNHPARRAALGACDHFNSVAILAANEYTDAQSIYYHPSMKDTRMDPRIRYPEIMTDQSGDPMRPRGCTTEEALKAAPQLPIANLACASHALQMFWFYYFVAPKMDIESRKHWPIEHTNNFNKLFTRTEEYYAAA